MDISSWPLSKIMQLPDSCFGARWWVGDYMGSTTGVVHYTAGEEALPHRFVVWGVLISARSPACLEALRLTIRLAGSKPSSVAGVITMRRLLNSISDENILYEFYVNPNGTTWIGSNRQLVEPSGGRLAYVSNGDQVIAYEMTVGVLISAVPTEAPDWLVKA